jgi:hypothetical protein
MKENFIKGILAFAALFALLFLGRWAVLYTESLHANIDVPVPVYQPAVVSSQEVQLNGKAGEDDETEKEEAAEPPQAASIAFHNYAKETLPSEAVPNGGPNGPASAPVEQTYERVACLASRTRNFDADEKKVRDYIQTNLALVQQEENTGLKGSRLLTLTLGVEPVRFDAVVEALKGAGELVSFQATKTDKTQDHLALAARRASLQKNMAELVALKGTGGKMADLLDLQDKIFRLEKQIGDMGVEISQYEGATGLCTVLLTLKEIGPGPSIWRLAAQAFDWAAGTCLSWLGWIFLVSIGWLVLLWIANKAQAIGAAPKKGTAKGVLAFVPKAKRTKR